LILQYLTGPGGAGRKYPHFNRHITDISHGPRKMTFLAREAPAQQVRFRLHVIFLAVYSDLENQDVIEKRHETPPDTILHSI
jgi:hypothetical protein